MVSDGGEVKFKLYLFCKICQLALRLSYNNLVLCKIFVLAKLDIILILNKYIFI